MEGSSAACLNCLHEWRVFIWGVPKNKKNKIWRVLYWGGGGGLQVEMQRWSRELWSFPYIWVSASLPGVYIAQEACRPYRETSIQHGPHNARAWSLSSASLREGWHGARKHLKIFHWCLSIPSPTRPKNGLEKASPDSEMQKLKPKNKPRPKQGTPVWMEDNCGPHGTVPTAGSGHRPQMVHSSSEEKKW